MDTNPYDEWPPPSPVVRDPASEIRRTRIEDHLNFDFEGLLNHFADHAENATGNYFDVRGNRPQSTMPSAFRVYFEIQGERPMIFVITGIDQIY